MISTEKPLADLNEQWMILLDLNTDKSHHTNTTNIGEKKKIKLWAVFLHLEIEFPVQLT